MPKQKLAVQEVTPDGTILLDVDGEQVALGQGLAHNLWVLPDR
jgi:Fe2+ transport system protein FeoA